MGDYRASQPFMHFNPATTSTTQFWHARKFRDSASVMRGGMCEDSSSGCFAGAFMGRKFKHNASAREFERSLECLLDDLSSATSSCGDLQAVTGNYDVKPNTGSCTNLSVPRLTVPQPNRPARSCMNLTLSSPGEAGRMNSFAPYNASKNEPSRDGILIDVSIRDKPQYRPSYTSRPLSDTFGAKGYSKYSYQPLQRTNSLLDVTGSERRKANQRLKQSHSMNFDEDIENMLSELDSAIDELHQYAYELESDKSTRSRYNSDSKSSVISPASQASSSKLNLSRSTYLTNGDTGFVSDSDTDSEYSSTMYSTLDSVAPTIIVSSSVDSVSSSLSSESLDDTLICDLSVIEVKPESDSKNDNFAKEAKKPIIKQNDSQNYPKHGNPRDKTPDRITWKRNDSYSLSSISSFDSSMDSITSGRSHKVLEQKFKNPIKTTVKPQLQEPTYKGKSPEITTVPAIPETKVRHINTNPNVKRPIIHHQNLTDSKTETFQTRTSANGGSSYKPRVPERKNSLLAFNYCSLLDNYSIKTDRILESESLQSKRTSATQSNLIGQDSTVSSFTDLSVIDSEMGYTADRDTCTETPLTGLPSWKDTSHNLNNKCTLDEYFVPQLGFRPLNFVGTESRYMIKPIKANDLRIPTPIKLRKEISTQTYDTTNKSNSEKYHCKQDKQTYLVSSCTQTESVSIGESCDLSETLVTSNTTNNTVELKVPVLQRSASYSSSLTVSPALVSGAHLSGTRDKTKSSCKSPTSIIAHFCGESLPISIKPETLIHGKLNTDQGLKHQGARPREIVETVRKPLILVSDECNGSSTNATKFYVTMNCAGLHRSNSLPDIRQVKSDRLETLQHQYNNSLQRYSSTVIITNLNKPTQAVSIDTDGLSNPISSVSIASDGICNSPQSNILHSPDNCVPFTHKQNSQREKELPANKQEMNETKTSSGHCNTSSDMLRSGSNNRHLINGCTVESKKGTPQISERSANVNNSPSSLLSPLANKMYNKAKNKCLKEQDNLAYCWKHSKFCGRKQCMFDRKQKGVFHLPSYTKLPRIAIKKQRGTDIKKQQMNQDRKPTASQITTNQPKESTYRRNTLNNHPASSQENNIFENDLSISDCSSKSESEPNTLSSISSLTSSGTTSKTSSKSKKYGPLEMDHPGVKIYRV